jgi:hypothetical protein
MSRKNSLEIVRNFIVSLQENREPTRLFEYIQELEDILFSLKPSSRRDASRLSVAQESVRRVRREAKRMEERVKELEELNSPK